MDKTDTTKDMMGTTEERLVRENDGIRDLRDLIM